MRIESKLCHLSENKVIVQVSGWVNDKNVGSSLAEATTVELAEDKAILRLNKRLGIVNSNQSSKKVTTEINNNKKEHDKTKMDISVETNKANVIPNDWSNELAEIDAEINRLNWTREDEIRFLETNFGYNNRNKITVYNELISYLQMLKKINILESSISNEININNLINESEMLLKELSWNYKKGSEYLQKEFNVSTRKELDESQLKLFVNKLKIIRNQNSSDQKLTN